MYPLQTMKIEEYKAGYGQGLVIFLERLRLQVVTLLDGCGLTSA
jgi:hypothetical protein